MISFKNFKRRKLSVIPEIISKLNIKLFVTLLCLIFIGKSIHGNYNALSNQIIGQKEILWLLGGLIFSFLSIIINAYAWKLLIESIGCNSNKLNIIKIFLNTNIYKYLPGGIWHFVTRYNILRLEFSNDKSVESILLEPILMLVAGLIFVPFGSSNIYIFVLCWLSTLVLLTRFREFMIKRLKAMKRSIFTGHNKVDNSNLLRNKQNTLRKTYYPYNSLLVEIVFILFRFFGFLCCLSAFSIESSISYLELISSFSLAWIIGLIVPAAPGGLGVFESVFLVALSSKLPEASLLATLLFYRVVSTFSDILASLVYPAKRLFKV